MDPNDELPWLPNPSSHTAQTFGWSSDKEASEPILQPFEGNQEINPSYSYNSLAEANDFSTTTSAVIPANVVHGGTSRAGGGIPSLECGLLPYTGHSNSNTDVDIFTPGMQQIRAASEEGEEISRNVPFQSCNWGPCPNASGPCQYRCCAPNAMISPYGHHYQTGSTNYCVPANVTPNQSQSPLVGGQTVTLSNAVYGDSNAPSAPFSDEIPFGVMSRQFESPLAGGSVGRSGNPLYGSSNTPSASLHGAVPSQTLSGLLQPPLVGECSGSVPFFETACEYGKSSLHPILC